MCFEYWEKYYISINKTMSPNGYNLYEGGRYLGEYDLETRTKISKSLKGNTNALGCIRNYETRMKMSRSQKGHPSSQTVKDRNTELKGNKNSTQFPGISGHKGIHIRKNGKFSSSLYIFGKRISGGVYDTLDEAINVRNGLERKYRK
jgi:hypothetical protein